MASFKTTSLDVLLADITQVEADVIVNAANSSLLGGGGVDGAIHRAGGPSILAECRILRQTSGKCPPGQAVITGAGNLKAKYVVHTVGPIWSAGVEDDAATLADCYRNSLVLADSHGARSIAFPNIATGVYRFPKKLAAPIALRAVLDFLDRGPTTLEQVLFVCFDSENYDLYRDELDGKRILLKT